MKNSGVDSWMGGPFVPVWYYQIYQTVVCLYGKQQFYTRRRETRGGEIAQLLAAVHSHRLDIYSRWLLITLFCSFRKTQKKWGPPTGEYILGGHDAIFYQQGKNWKKKKQKKKGTGGNLWATASLRSLVYIPSICTRWWVLYLFSPINIE